MFMFRLSLKAFGCLIGGPTAVCYDDSFFATYRLVQPLGSDI